MGQAPDDMMSAVSASLAERTGRSLAEWVALVQASGFDRQESGDCTSRVVFPELAMSAALPAFERTTVRLDPVAAGSFGFACGMNMVHGTLVVEPPGTSAAPGAVAAAPGAVAAAPAAVTDPPGTGAAARGAVAATVVPVAGDGRTGTEQGAGPADTEAAQAAERRAEVADLTRRGDVAPLAGLGAQLQAAGHDIVIVADAPYARLAEDAGSASPPRGRGWAARRRRGGRAGSGPVVPPWPRPGRP